MKTSGIILFIACLLFISGTVQAQSTPILIGGEDTELSPEGVISGSGSSEWGGLGAAVLDNFNIYYQPLGEGDFVDNFFPDPEVYSFQMNIPDALPNYQSQGQHGGFWDSRGRNNEGVLPWINRNWRGGEFYDARYRTAGEESPYGVVSDAVQWTIDYWDIEEDDEEICFIHTCLTGMVEDFHYDEETGDATALLVLLNTAYLGYGDDGEPGPGAVEYDGGTYQGFDSFRESSGLLDYPAYFFQYDGEENSGSLTPCGTKITLKDEDGRVKGYFDVIQEAIDASEDGDLVLVSPGTYVENINFEGKEIVVMGNPDDPSEVIIDGDSDGSSVIVFSSNEGNDAILDGFTVQNGETDYGGGIYINGASPILQHLVVHNNQAESNGGGIYCTNESTPVINSTVIDSNGAIFGGGISCNNESVLSLNDVLIIDNTAIDPDRASGGGGVHCTGSSSIEMMNVRISDNSTSAVGGGIFLYNGSEATLIGCSITNNTADTRGGGLALINSSISVTRSLIVNNNANSGGAFSCQGAVLILTNVTICDNTSENRVIIVLYQSAELTISNSIFWENERFAILGEDGEFGVEIHHCDIDGGRDAIGIGEINWGDGNIDEDPLFVDSDECDYHLTEDSPCIDAGDPDSPEDPDETRADMGAYYFHQCGQYIDVPDDYETIQAAINASDDGDTVLVSPGTYVENIDFIGKDIVVGSLFLTTEDEAYIDSTVIDGDSSSTVVTFTNEETEDAELVGFIIQNGAVDVNGGGIRCSGSCPTIRNCIVQNNHVGTRGGGISCEPNANPNIIDCTIIRNTSQSGGGGIWCGEGSSPVISGCLIAQNEAGWNGAGINMYIDCVPVISNCTIFANSADHKGGGIIVSQDCSPIISECLIWHNQSTDNGGGITIERGAVPVFDRCTIMRNHTFGDGGAVACLENAEPVMINCTITQNTFMEGSGAIFLSASNMIIANTIVWYNDGFLMSPTIFFDPDSAASSVTIAYSDIDGGEDGIQTSNNGEVNWLDGNIDSDPLFIDEIEADFNLTEGSPCIDAGTTFFVWEGDTLINMTGDEYQGFAPDMGAFESPYENSVDGSKYTPNVFALYPSFPNPFNSTTTIRYGLPYRSDVLLQVYNLSGQRITTLFEGNKQAGVHTVNLNANDLPSGLYFVRLKASDQVFTQKVMLIK